MPPKRAGRSSIGRRNHFRPHSFEALEDRRLLSLTPEMVADLRVLPASSNPDSFFPVGEALYFSAATLEHGRELWVSDGTAAGTRLVIDLVPGSASLRHFAEFGGKLYFVAGRHDGTTDLYCTDGTAEGTFKPIDEQSFDNIDKLAVANDRLFFLYRNSEQQIFASSDGTTEGTIALPTEFSNKAIMHSLGSKLVVIDEFMHLSDGTPDGTFRLEGVQAMREMAVLNGIGMFFRRSASGEYEIWKTDGTPEGTQQVKDISPGPLGSISTGPNSIKEANGVAYFAADDGVHGMEPFRSDGTAEGTFAMREIANGFAPGFYAFMGALDDVLFYSRNNPDGLGLYALRNGQLNRVAGFPLNTDIAFANLNDELYFLVEAVSDDTSWTLWKSDGTSEGTVQVATIPNVLSAPSLTTAVFGGRIWFAAEDAEHGRELWSSDGTSEGTHLFRDIAEGMSPDGADPRTLKSVGDNLFFQFSGLQSLATYDLWVLPSDGVPRQLTHGLFADPIIEQMPLVELDGSVVFGRSPNHFVGDFGVWRSDGTSEGTFGIGLTANFQEPYMMTKVDGDIYFATSTSPQNQLWKTDGTAVGTVVVANLPLGDGVPIDDYFFDRPVGAGGLLFFSTIGSAKLWRSDGTPEGTFSLGPMSGARNPIRALGNAAFFFRPSHQRQLWASDGTLEGTRQIALTSAVPTDFLGTAGGKLYFTASSAVHGLELWATDGSEAGTYMVADITPNGSSKFGAYTAFGDQFVFVADDGTHGMELWITDGTSAGTRILDDAIPGVGSLDPKNLTSVQGAVFFTGNDGVHGRELWRISPSQPAEMIADIAPGDWSSMRLSQFRTAEIVEHQGDLYFGANDGVHGFELWKIDRPAGDTNFDGRVDLVDLNNVRNHFGGTGLGDADGDGDVDLDDLNLVRNHFGGAPAAPATLTHDAARGYLTPMKSRASAVDLLFAGYHVAVGEASVIPGHRKLRRASGA